MKTKILVIILATSSILFSCRSKPVEQHGYEVESERSVEMDLSEPSEVKETVNFDEPIAAENEQNSNLKTETLDHKTPVSKKKIIKDGDITVKTIDINASKKSIDDLLKKLNAYYESEELQNSDNLIAYNLKIRVPAHDFETLILSIENGTDEIIGKSIQARDITEEYVDIETRLANKREYLNRYKELLSKASSVNDILAIEQNIGALEEEIESKEGRLKYLSDQVSFSTLAIKLYQEKEIIYKSQLKDKFTERLKKSVRNGWTSVVGFVLWLIAIWPYLLLITAGILVFKRVTKKRKSKQ